MVRVRPKGRQIWSMPGIRESFIVLGHRWGGEFYGGAAGGWYSRKGRHLWCRGEVYGWLSGASLLKNPSIPSLSTTFLIKRGEVYGCLVG